MENIMLHRESSQDNRDSFLMNSLGEDMSLDHQQSSKRRLNERSFSQSESNPLTRPSKKGRKDDKMPFTPNVASPSSLLYF